MRRFLAVLALFGLLAAPAPAQAIDLSFVKEQPIATIFALPALLATMPFMAVDWVITKIRESGDDDEEGDE